MTTLDNRYLVNAYDSEGWSFIGLTESMEEAKSLINEDWNDIGSCYHKEAYIVPMDYTYQSKKCTKIPEIEENLEDDYLDKYFYQIIDLDRVSYL